MDIDNATLTWQVRLSPRTLAELVLWAREHAAEAGLSLVTKGGTLRLALETFTELLRSSGQVQPVRSLEEALSIFQEAGLVGVGGMKELSKAGRVRKFVTALSYEGGAYSERLGDSKQVKHPVEEGFKGLPAAKSPVEAAEQLAWSQFNQMREEQGRPALTFQQFVDSKAAGADLLTVEWEEPSSSGAEATPEELRRQMLAGLVTPTV